MSKANQGDLVTVRGHEGLWEVTVVVDQPSDLKTAGGGDNAYYLAHVETGHSLYTNDPNIEVYRRAAQ